MCLPVAVPADPRIPAGTRFLRISGDISGDISPDTSGNRGVAETSSPFKIDHWSILQEEMSTIRAMLAISFLKIK